MSYQTGKTQSKARQSKARQGKARADQRFSFSCIARSKNRTTGFSRIKNKKSPHQ